MRCLTSRTTPTSIGSRSRCANTRRRSATSSLRWPLVEGESLTRVIADPALFGALAAKPIEARVREVAGLYTQELERLARSEPRPTVVLLPISEQTWDACVADDAPR